MIDLHCHVLPAVDDGPATVEDALDLARGAAADGITTIAATPHVDWSHQHLDGDRIRAEVAALRERLDTAGIAVKIVPGGELAATWAAALDDADLRCLTLGGGPWLLLECPLSASLAPGFAGVARSLVSRRFRILLAHPERSPLFLRTPKLLDELIDEGMLAQVTAGSLTGRFGRPVRTFALKLVEQGSAHVVASDGHHTGRPARIASELAAAGIPPELGDWLARQMPEAVLAGTALPPRPAQPARTVRGRVLRLVGR
jgi:protein-tyrosine phosphatase